MSKPTQAYRVKVLVDGDWKSAGDFLDLDRAKQHATLIALHLERHVEIRDRFGTLIETDFLSSLAGDASGTLKFDDWPVGQALFLD